jgi:hypothetical protein
LEQCEETPSYVERRDKVVHTDFREEDCEGQLSQDRTESVDCLEMHELITVEVEIFGEAGYVGVFWLKVSLPLDEMMGVRRLTDVCLIEVFDLQEIWRSAMSNDITVSRALSRPVVETRQLQRLAFHSLAAVF